MSARPQSGRRSSPCALRRKVHRRGNKNRIFVLLRPDDDEARLLRSGRDLVPRRGEEPSSCISGCARPMARRGATTAHASRAAHVLRRGEEPRLNLRK